MMKYVFIVLFFAVMIGVGIYSKKKVLSVNDFLLGGRNMGGWISAFSYGTTYFSAVIFIGYAGKSGWSFGLSATWIGIGNAIIGSLLAWLILAKRTRSMTHELNASTMPEFFEKRYNSRAMKIVTAVIIFVFLVPYSASVYQGLSYLFEMVFNVPYIYCMVAIAVLTGIYLMIGGYVATAINNFIQGIIMLAGLLLMVFFIVSHDAVGGLKEGIARLGSIPGDGLGLVKIFSDNPFNLLSLVILTSLGTWGLPQMVHKFYTIKDDDAIKRGTIVSTVFALIIAGGSYFIGAFGRLFLNNTPPMVNGVPNYDMVMPQVLDAALPESLMVLVVVLLLSASMSTLSSLVLVSSSAISLDLLKGVFFPDMKKEKVMLITRILCVVFVALSFLVAATPNAIITLMSFSWGTIAGAFLAPFLYGLYWKNTTKAGAWAGFISGLCCSLGGTLIYGMNAQYAPIIGSVAMLVSLAVVPAVSFFTSRLPQSYVESIFNKELKTQELDA